MASTFKNLYGTNGQSITITADALANAAARQSTPVDNTTNLFLDALVAVKIVSNAAGVSSTGTVSVYAFGTANGGTDYTEGAGAADAAITLTSPTNLKLIGVINVVANGVTYKSGPFSVAKAFDGILPDHWGIILLNSSGAALGTGCTAVYQGIQEQAV